MIEDILIEILERLEMIENRLTRLEVECEIFEVEENDFLGTIPSPNDMNQPNLNSYIPYRTADRGVVIRGVLK